MATLSEIVAFNASYVRKSGFSVSICRRLDTVSIDSYANPEEEIFLQGDDARQFIAEADALYAELPLMSFDTINCHLAKPYVENLG